MKKTPKIDMYDPQIYPRRLYVAVEVEDLHKYFRLLSTDSKVDLLMMRLEKTFKRKITQW